MNPPPAHISNATWILGLLAWMLLLLGAPLMPIAFVGCFGGVLCLAAVILVSIFAAKVLHQTQRSAGRHRALGLAAFLLGMAAILGSAWTPIGLFESVYEANTRFKLTGPESPTPQMMVTIWWEHHSILELGALWVAAAALFGGGLRLLGETSKVRIFAASACAGATGPLLLATCIHLVRQGWRSGN